jgi:hypothetical protein
VKWIIHQGVRILAVNNYALREIETAGNSAYPRPRGLPSRILSSLLPYPFKADPTNAVTRTFIEALSVLSTAMTRLIVEAEANISNLDQLEESLNVFHELMTREDSSLAEAKSELLSLLWTKLGGNQRELRKHEENLFLLQNLGSYRKRALAHVVTALQTLQGMSEDMEELRDRVAAPEIVQGKIPLEVHINSIKGGLERLQDGKLRTKEKDAAAMKVFAIEGW